MTLRRHSLFGGFAVTIAMLFVVSAQGALETWVGNTSANFGDAANWNPAAVPIAGDNLVFGAAGTAGATLNNNLAVDTSLGVITFNPGASGFTINGNEIQLLGQTANGFLPGIANNSTTTQIINAPIAVASTRNINLTTGGGNLTLGGVVSGPGGLTTVGLGAAAPATLNLSVANTHTGGTTIGTNTVLRLGNANSVQNSTVTLNSTVANSFTFAPGMGTANLGGLASAAGAGSFTMSDGTNPVNLSVGLNNANTTYAGVMSGGGSLIKVGTGTFTLTGANAYTGTTTINNGGITVTGTGSGLSSSGLSLGGGALTVNNAATNLSFLAGGTTLNNGASSITDTAGSIALGAITRNVGGTLNLTLTVSNVVSTTGTASTILTDNGVAYATVGQDWAAKNAGNTNIVGLSTITGGYTNSTATSLAGNADVAAGIDTTLSSATSITSLRFNLAEARTLTLGSSTLTTGGILNTTTVAANASTITGGTLRGAAGRDLVVIQNNNNALGAMTIASTISDNGSATGLTKAGGGTLILTGTNNYTGATRINAGALQFTTLANLGTGGPITLNGGTLQYATGSTVDLSASGRTITFNPSNGQLGGNIDTNGNNVTFANVIGAGSTGTLIKTGLGTLTLNSANAVNTTTNITLVPTVRAAGGVLQLGNANTVQNGTLSVTGALALGFSPGIGTFNIGGLVDGGSFALNDTSGAPVTLNVGGNNTLTTFNGTMIGSGSFVKVGTGTLNLSGQNSIFTGNVVVNGGILQASGGGGGNQNNGYSSPLGALLIGPGLSPARTITVNNGATLVFTTNNIFGNAHDNGGGGSTLGIGPNTPPIIVNSGSTLATNRYNVVGGVTLNGASMVSSSQDNGNFEGWQYIGTIAAGGSAPSRIESANLRAHHLDINTTFNVADATGNANADLIHSAVLRDRSGDFGPSPGGLTKTGSGTMLLSGANIYTGNTTVAQGTLSVAGQTVAQTTDTGSFANGSAAVTGLVTGTAGLTVGQPVSGTGIPASTRILSIDGANAITLSNLTNAAGAGATITFGAAAPLGLGGANSTVTVASGATLNTTAIAGGLSLAANHRIAVNGTLTGNLNLNNSNTLSGTGTVGNVTLSSGSIAPGNSVGTINLSSLTMSGGTLALEIGGATSDVVNVTGAATFTGGSLALSLGGTVAPTLLTYNVLTAGSPLTGAPGLGAGTLGRSTYTIDGTTPNIVRIAFAAKPAANVTFTGGNGNWTNTQTDAIWTTADSGIADPTHYYDGDYVTFNDANGGNYTVNVNSTLTPTLVTVNNSAGNYNFGGGGSISGAASLVKTGTGALILNNVNSHTGGVTLNQGRLEINNTNALGAGPLTIGAGTTIDNTSGGPLTVATNNPQVWNGSFTFTGFADLNLGTGVVTLNSNPTITVNGSRLTIGGSIRDGTGNSITYAGSGTVAPNGGAQVNSSLYSGTTTIGPGVTVIANVDNTFGAVPGGAVTVQSGGMIQLAGAGGGNALNLGRKQFFIAGDGVNGAGAIANSGPNNQQNALQLVTLTGDASIGGTSRLDIRGPNIATVNQAVLNLNGFTLTDNNTNTFPLVNVEVSDGNIVVAAPNPNAGNGTFQQLGTLGLEALTNVVNFNSGKSITLNAGAGISFFDYRGTLTRPITMNDGSRMLSNGGGNNTHTVGSNITLIGNGTFSATGTGTGTIILNGGLGEATPGGGSITQAAVGTGAGASTLILGGNNTFTGGVTISGGILQLNSAGALNSTTPNVVTMTGGGPQAPRMRLNGISATVAGLISTGGGGASTAIVENNSLTSATLTVNNATENAFDGILQNSPAGGPAGTLGLTKSGAGTLILSGASTYTGPTTINAGILQLGNGGATGGLSGTSGVSGNGTLAFNRTGDFTFAAPISGGVSLTKAGTGTITLSGASNSSGATTINAGTLSVTGSLGSAGTVNVSGGGLAGNGNGTTTGRVGNVIMSGSGSIRPGITGADGSAGSLTMNSFTVNAGDFRVDVGGDMVNVTGLANFTAPSTISPTGGVAAGLYTILSAGTLTIGAGASPTVNQIPGARLTFSLMTTPGANGTIKVNVVGNIGNLIWKGNLGGGAWDLNTTQNWTNLNGNINDFFLNTDNVTFDNTGTNKTVTLNTAVLPGSVTVNNSTGNDYIITGTGSIGGTTGLTKTGTGTVTISTANTYNGSTAVQNGRLVLGNAAAIPSTSSIVLGSGTTSGVLDLNGQIVTATSLSTSGTGTANIVGSSSTSSTLTINGGSFEGIIQDVIGVDNGQTVGLTVSSGTLTLTGNNTCSGFTTVASGATLQVGNGGTTGTLGAIQGTLDGALVFNHSNDSQFPGAMTGVGSVQNIGTGTTAISGDNSLTGVTTISAGALQLGSGGGTGSLGTGGVVNNGTLIFNRNDDISTPFTFPNVVSGTGGLRKDGPGAVLLSGLNSFTGNVVVNDGTLIAQTTQQDTGLVEALGNMRLTTKTITVNPLGRLEFRINNVFGNQGNTSVIAATADGRNLPTTILNGGTLHTQARYNQIGNITFNGGTLSQTGETGANYSGWQFLGDITVIGTAPSTMTTTNGEENHLGINTVFNVANVTGNADPDLIVDVTLRNRSGDYATGLGNFIKTGNGTMQLLRTNTYTGSTAVNQGTLVLAVANATNAASALSLGGGKLDTGGFAQAMNALTLAAGSVIDLGAGASVITFTDSSAALWTAGATLSIANWTGTLGAGGGTDQLIFGTTNTGLLASQVSQIHFQGFNGATILATGEVVPNSISTRLLGDFSGDGHVNVVDIATAMIALSNLPAFKAGLTNDDFLNIADVDLSGAVTNADLQGLIDYLKGGNGSTAPVPEPATILLAGIGLAALVMSRRRSRC